MEAVSNLNENQEMVGTVVKVIFSASKDNYAIVSMKSDDIPDFATSKDYPDRFVAVGCFARVMEKQDFLLKGRWTKHQTYGWRFSVTDANEVIQESHDGLIRYLSSGLFKGIGPKTAELVVKKFGDKTLQIIKSNPGRLIEIKGISKSKVDTIAAGYKDFKYLEKLMLKLKPYDVTNKKIVKIYNKYGEKAISILDENPYRLCDDIDGIGFKIADQIARACSIDFKNEFRIRAGINYVLTKAGSSDGHLYLTRRSLLIRIKKILNTKEGEIEKEDILPILEAMEEKEEVIIEGTDIYLPIYYNAEIYCGDKLSKILGTATDMFKFDVVQTIKEMEDVENIKYAAKQKEAIRNIEYCNLLVITGGPGTGKTTIIKGIINLYKKNFPGKKILLAAPTGRAAKRMREATGMEAKTIHRHLEYKNSEDNNVFCGRNENNPIDADLIIIDESSMIDMLLFSKFLKAVSLKTKLVFVGDADQLPSVGAGNVFRDMIDSKEVPVVTLNEIFRQANTSKIIINADLINKGETKLELGNDFAFIKEDDDELVPMLIKEKYVEELKAAGGDIDKVQVLSPYRVKTCTGVDSLNKLLQNTVNPLKGNDRGINFGKKTFRIHDKVMQFKNDYDKEVFNGDMGYIDDMRKTEENEDLVEINMNDSIVEYKRDDLEDLDLAYATTVHKSQGSEYDVVIMPVSMQHYIFLQRNLFYTALTRAKKKVILIGSYAALAIAIKNNKIASRNSKLKERIKG